MSYIKRFLLLNLKEYENIAIPFPFGLVVTGVILALIAAAFVINYRKLYTTALLRQLVRHSAIGEDKAKTLSALRADTPSIRRALMRSGSLTHYVKMAGKKELSYDEYMEKSSQKGYKGEVVDFSTAAFYIEEEHEKDVKNLLERPTEGWSSPIILTVILLFTWLLCFLFAEELLILINNYAEK